MSKSKNDRVEGKPKGNSYERKAAKQLSIWMFDNPKILYKHEDSGARKIVYSGDIIPKDADNFPWKFWPFIVECKSGYKTRIPTLCGNQTFLRECLIKLLNERTFSQRIPFFIAQFYNRQPILMTNIKLNFFSPNTLTLELGDNKYELFYVYEFNEILKKDFIKIMPEWFYDTINTPLTPAQKAPFKPIITSCKQIYNKKQQIADMIDEIISSK